MSALFSEFVMSVSSPASSDWTLFLLVAAVVALALSLIHYLEVMSCSTPKRGSSLWRPLGFGSSRIRAFRYL